MTYPIVPMPDAEAVAIGILAPLRDDGVTVGTEWPEDLAAHLPAVAVTRGGGGGGIRYVTDEPTLDIDVLAADKATAHDLAQDVRARLLAARGTVQGGVRIYDVDDTNLIWLPDDATGIPRYVLVMSMVTRPAPVAP